MLGRLQTPLGIEQNGAGVLGENFGDVGLELGQTLVGGPGTQGFLERTALVHSGSGDDSVFVRHILHSLNFSRCKFQGKPPQARSARYEFVIRPY